MKANEAPEKLYFGEFDKTGLEAYSNRESDNEVEYTRTDVFIEKACEWLEKNIAEATGIDSYAITESFKQAMGE